MGEPGNEASSSINLRPRILVADPIAESGLDEFRKFADVVVASGTAPEDLVVCLSDVVALVVRSETKVTAAVMDQAPQLRVIGRAGVGVDNIDVDAATERGILVLNSPSGNTVAAAEHAIAMMFAMMRNIPAADRSMREGKWDRKRFSGQEVRGKTLSVVGLGKIGSEVARTASHGLGMRVLAFDPLVTDERAEQVGARMGDLQTVLKAADIVTVHVPAMRETQGMIGKKELGWMREGSRIINVARGGIVDEQALLSAVESGHLAGAAVDVFSEEPLPPDHPFRSCSRIVLTPHLGASTEEAQINVAVDVAHQIRQYLGGEMPPFPVNAPSVRPEELADAGPLVDLALRMGSFLAQIVSGPIERLECRYSGSISKPVTGYLTAQVLQGFLHHFSASPVNQVNAAIVAKSMGISFSEESSTRPVEGRQVITVEARGPSPHRISGTTIDGSPRIIDLDEFRVDVHPEGIFLVVTHDDRPGVIAGISAALAGQEINIARIDLGRDQPRGRAVLLMQVDDKVSSDVLEHIRGVTGLRSLQLVEL